MKAVRFAGVGALDLCEVDTPRPGPRDLLVRVEACGICGTDRHIVRGEFPANPVTLGHEFSGIVEAVGSAVTEVSVGARVTGDPNISCGRCAACRRGRVNLCENLSALGVTRDGGFATHALVPVAQAHALPLSLDPLFGAFCEPLACCVHGMDRAGVQPGATVAVLGGGVIGLLTVQLARLAGASAVLVTRQAAKRRLGEQLGATASLDPSTGDLRDTLAGPQGLLPGGADVVVECAGVSETVAVAPWVARRGGTVAVLGVLAPAERVALAPFDFLVRELTVVASFLNPFTHARAAALIADGRVAVTPLISRCIGLDEAAAAIKAPAPGGEVRAIVVPD